MPEERKRIKEPVDSWFEESGVPHFIHHYSTAKRLPDLSILLCVVLAFELGIAPWVELDALQLAVAPIVLFVLTLWARPALLPLFDLEPKQGGVVSMAIRFVLFGAAVGYLAGMLSVPRMDAWVNFGVLLVTFAAATVAFSRRLWIGDEPSARRLRRRLLKLLVAAVVVFALEGSVVDPVDQALGIGGMPQGVPALALVVLLLLLAIRLSRRCPRHPTLGHPNLAAEFQLAAVPALLLIFGAETAVLPHVADEGWVQAAVPLGLMIAGLAIAVGAAIATCRAGAQAAYGGNVGHRENATAATVALWTLALMFALGYPVLAWLYFTVEAFGTSLTGADAFWLTFGINVVCLILGWLSVSLGLDRVAVWTARAVWRSKLTILAGMARGLPLLLVFLAFFVMQAELWEVVVEIGTPQYLGLVGLMLVLAVVFGYVAAHKEVDRCSRFDSWRDVYRAAVPASRHDPPPPEPFRSELEQLAANQDTPSPAALSRFKYLNAVAVMGVYQTVILLPVALAAAALFWVVGRMAVPASVAGEWVYGDGAPPRLGQALAERALLEQPWTRVAVILGAFSALYLAVQALSTPEQRKDFFEGADASVRQRLAVRVAYVHLVPPDPVEDESKLERLKRKLSWQLYQWRHTAERS